VKDLAANLRLSIASNQTVRVRLLKNGVFVPGFELTFTGPITPNTPGAILTVATPTETFLVGQTLDLEVVTTGITGPGIPLSATLGLV
jgi:hypothetical protein